MIFLTALVASALTLGAPNTAAAAELGLAVAPVSLMDDSDDDKNRGRGRGGDRGRRGRGNDSDRDSDRDSDGRWDRDRRDRRDGRDGVWNARNRRDRDGDWDRRNRRDRDSDWDRRNRRRNGDWDRNRRDGRSGNCIDINRDGRCDFGTGNRTADRRTDRSRGRTDCVDNNRNGRCDYGTSRSGSRPTTGGMPDMLSSVLFGRGQRANADRWLPSGVRNVRYVDQDRNRLPERATFLDGAGRIAQVWLDDNRDGRADRVQYYQNGRLLRTAIR